VGIDLPAAVELTAVETEPGLKSATASNVTKPAKTGTGLVVQAPAYINEGEKDPRGHQRRRLPEPGVSGFSPSTFRPIPLHIRPRILDCHV